MGEKIDFPYNNKMYLEKAKRCLYENDYEQACFYVDKVYRAERSYTTNLIFTLILYNLEQYKKALSIADEYKDLYLENDDDRLMYAMLLIKNHQFLEAERLIQKQLKNSFSAFEKEWADVKQQLEAERELFNRETERQRQKIKYKLLELSHFSLFEQTKLIADAHSLLLEDLQEVAGQIFNNPLVSDQLQKAFLEILIEKGDPACYKLSWFNQLKEICPKDLHVFDQMPIREEMDTVLQDKLHQSPNLYDTIQTEAMADLLLLYPFIEEVITDVPYWVDLYIAQFTDSGESQKEPASSEQEKMAKWMEQLNQIAQRNRQKKQPHTVVAGWPVKEL